MRSLSDWFFCQELGFRNASLVSLQLFYIFAPDFDRQPRRAAFLSVNKILLNMEKRNKEIYEAPSLEVIEVALEGIVCASDMKTSGDPTYNKFNNEEEW